MPAVRLIMSRTQVAMHFGHDQSQTHSRPNSDRSEIFPGDKAIWDSDFEEFEFPSALQ